MLRLGYGIFAMKRFNRSEFLLEYAGELVTAAEGEERQEKYQPGLGSYLFFFKKHW